MARVTGSSSPALATKEKTNPIRRAKMAGDLHYAYRTYGDGPPQDATMRTDPTTGEYPDIHPAGDVFAFDSEGARDEYIGDGYVSTTLPDGRMPKIHAVHAITAEEGTWFLDRCAAPMMCLHTSQAERGAQRVPA